MKKVFLERWGEAAKREGGSDAYAMKSATPRMRDLTDSILTSCGCRGVERESLFDLRDMSEPTARGVLALLKERVFCRAL